MSNDDPAFLPFDDDADSRFIIVASQYNSELVEALIKDVTEELQTAGGVTENQIHLFRVPGAHEIPFAVGLLSSDPEAVIIALGVVVGGDTQHHNVIAESTSRALIEISHANRVPIINGIITTDSREHAEERTRGAKRRGAGFAQAALALRDTSDDIYAYLDEFAPMPSSAEMREMLGDRFADMLDDYEELELEDDEDGPRQ